MTPRKLADAIKKCKGRYHAVAEELTRKAKEKGLPAVNVYYVYNYIKHGVEPRNSNIRKAMGFPPLRKKHNGRSGFAELPAHVQWWRKLPKGERDQWIQKNHRQSVT